MKTIYKAYANSKSKYILSLKKFGLEIIEEFNLLICYFDDENINFNAILSVLIEHNISFITSVEFSNEEIVNSEWLAIESAWTSLFPYPRDINKYLLKTYKLDDYCIGNEPSYYCRVGKKQIDLFHLERGPKWSTRNLLRVNWIFDELFVSERFKSTFENSELNGFDFKEVYIKDKEISHDVFQLHILNTLPMCIKQDSIREVLICPICKRSKYLLNKGFLYMDKNIMQGNKFDIVKTCEEFGQIDASSLIIISKKLYNVLVREKLDRGMKFIPVILK